VKPPHGVITPGQTSSAAVAEARSVLAPRPLTELAMFDEPPHPDARHGHPDALEGGDPGDRTPVDRVIETCTSVVARVCGWCARDGDDRRHDHKRSPRFWGDLD
jgi:hypothetical protein